MDRPKKKLAELTQRAFPWRTQTLELYEDRVELTTRGVLERYRIPYYLQVLKEDPDINLVVPSRGLALSLFLLAAGLVLAILGWRPHDAAAGAVLASLGGASLLCSLLMIRRINVYFYKAVGSDSASVRYVPQLWVYPGRPSDDEVRRFMDLIKATREKNMENVAIEHEEPIPYARELERFASLRKKEVLTEDEYVRVKAKLLNIKDRRIGF